MDQIFHQFRQKSEVFSASPGLDLYVGFSMNLPSELLCNLMKKGHWGVLYFAYNDKKDVQYGLRIMPQYPVSQWPVVATFQKLHSGTYAPRIDSFLYLSRIETLIDSPTYIHTLRKNWDVFIAKTSPLLDAFGWQNTIEDLTKYVHDDSNIPVDDHKWRSVKWADCVKSSDGDKYIYLNQIIDSMLEDENIIPDISGESLGIWETWAAHLTAARMVIKGSNYNNRQRSDILSKGFFQPSGFDPCDIVFSHRPDRSYDPYMGDFEIASALLQAPEYIVDDPLYGAVSDVVHKGKQAYDGSEHEKAATFFVNNNAPLRAWNALLSSAYWSGTNCPETSIPTWEKAINLCAQENWTDALNALNYQYNLYLKNK